MDVVKILPPLIIEDREVEYFINSFESVIQSLSNITGPMWSFGKNLVTAAIKSGYNSPTEPVTA